MCVMAVGGELWRVGETKQKQVGDGDVAILRPCQKRTYSGAGGEVNNSVQLINT